MAGKSDWLIGGLVVIGLAGAVLYFYPQILQGPLELAMRPFINEQGNDLSPLGKEVLEKYKAIQGGSTAGQQQSNFITTREGYSTISVA